MDENLPAYDMLYNTEDEDYYWYCLASRCIYAYTSDAYFGLLSVDDGYVHGNCLFTSNGPYPYLECAVRAVVTLASDIQLTAGRVTGTYDIK